MAQTHSLTTWPAQQWKQFLHGHILTVDGAFERANAPVYVWFTHLYETAIPVRIIQPLHVWFRLGACLFSRGEP